MSACVKCGNAGVGSRYGQDAFLAGDAVTMFYCLGANDRCQVEGGSPIVGEHLDRVCGACGYAWAEPCKDAKR